MKIRKCKKKDLKEIFYIYKQVYSEPPYNEAWTNKNLSDKLWDSFNCMRIYVVEEKNKIIGFIFFNVFIWDKEKRAYIEEIGVLKDFRGKGIATKLLNKIQELLKKENIKRILLDVNVKSRAFKLYKKLGYTKTDYIKLEKKLK